MAEEIAQLPLLPTQPIQIGLFDATGPDGERIVRATLTLGTVLGVQTYTLERRQCVELGSLLMKVAQDKMPHDEGPDLTVVKKPGLYVPGTP